MSEINPFEHPPVYKQEQVITMTDLAAIGQGFLLQYDRTPKYRFVKRFEFMVAIGTINGIAEWLYDGKRMSKIGDVK